MIILDVRNLSYNINTFRNIIKSSEEFLLSFLQLTGVPGIEPGSGVLETLILPMNYTPMYFFVKRLLNNTTGSIKCQEKF